MTADIVELPSAMITPDSLLDALMDETCDMQAIATVVIWNDGSLNVRWSQTTKANLCMMQRVFDQNVDDLIRGPK